MTHSDREKEYWHDSVLEQPAPQRQHRVRGLTAKNRQTAGQPGSHAFIGQDLIRTFRHPSRPSSSSSSPSSLSDQDRAAVSLASERLPCVAMTTRYRQITNPFPEIETRKLTRSGFTGRVASSPADGAPEIRRTVMTDYPTMFEPKEKLVVH